MKIGELIETQSQLRKGAKGSIPGLTTWKDLDNNDHPYLALRFGMMLAGAPENHEETNHEGPIGGKFTTISYTDVEQEMLDAVGKHMGVIGTKETSRKSSEVDDVGKFSPVSSWNSAAKSKKTVDKKSK